MGAVGKFKNFEPNHEEVLYAKGEDKAQLFLETMGLPKTYDINKIFDKTSLNEFSSSPNNYQWSIMVAGFPVECSKSCII